MIHDETPLWFTLPAQSITMLMKDQPLDSNVRKWIEDWDEELKIQKPVKKNK